MNQETIELARKLMKTPRTMLQAVIYIDLCRPNNFINIQPCVPRKHAPMPRTSTCEKLIEILDYVLNGEVPPDELFIPFDGTPLSRPWYHLTVLGMSDGTYHVVESNRNMEHSRFFFHELITVSSRKHLYRGFELLFRGFPVCDAFPEERSAIIPDGIAGRHLD